MATDGIDHGTSPDVNDVAPGRPAAAPTAQQRLTAELVSGTLSDTERAAKTAALKKSVASSDSPEERADLVASGVKGARKVFGIEGPPDAVQKFNHEAYAEFEGHEQDVLLWARSEGVEGDTVKSLREFGVEVAMRAEGKPITDADVKEFNTKFGSRLSQAQRDLLVKWWRTSVEGGGGAA